MENRIHEPFELEDQPEAEPRSEISQEKGLVYACPSQKNIYIPISI